MEDLMRTVYFRPYRRGMGPTFKLQLFYTGNENIGYRLSMRENNQKVVLFEGSDFRPSPLHSVDGDEAVKSLMTFLTLQPGDTDQEYFAKYTEAQLDYCSQHAEALNGEVYSRFGE